MIKPDDCILILGRRGCGKSYLAHNIQAMWPRRVIIDLLNEYSDGIKVKSFDHFCAQMALFKKEKTQNFTLIFQFDHETDASKPLFDQILRICFYFGNIQIVVEEIQEFTTPHEISHWMKKCLFVGRHQKLSLLFTTQRPGMLNKGILSQCAHVFCGQLIDGNDIRYVSGFLNESSDKLVKLPERRFIYFSKDGIREISNDFKA
jgi:hypothetical protein